MPYTKIYTKNIRQEIAAILKSVATFDENGDPLSLSRITVHIAVAWFTDRYLFDTLKVLHKEHGFVIYILLWDNEINKNSGLPWQELLNYNFIVMMLPNMHHKFCCVQDWGREKFISITGSYNWTNNAHHANHENIVVTDSKDTYNELVKEFDYLQNLWSSNFSALYMLQFYMKAIGFMEEHYWASSLSGLYEECWRGVVKLLVDYKNSENSTEIDEILLFTQAEGKIVATYKLNNLLRKYEDVLSVFDKLQNVVGVNSAGPIIYAVQQIDYKTEYRYYEGLKVQTGSQRLVKNSDVSADTVTVLYMLVGLDGVLRAYPHLDKKHLINAIDVEWYFDPQ